MNYQTKEVKANHYQYNIVYIDTIMHHHSWYSHEDEKDVRERDWHIKPGALILDVGAAYGSYSLSALAQGASKIYAWAPEAGCGDAPEKEFLEASLKLNDWQDKAFVYNSGFWNKSGWLDTTNQNFYTEVPKTIDNPNYFTKVNTLDNWYEGVKSLEDFSKYSEIWMKVDVEGAGVEVLKAATNLLKEIKPNIQVENHLFKNGNIETEVKKVLEDLGYEQISTHVYHSVSHCVYKVK